MHAQQLHDAGVIALLEQRQARLAAYIGLFQGVAVRRGQKTQRSPKQALASQRIDITEANLSILKNGHAKAVRFSTLEAICRELKCQPGDLLGYEQER